MVKLYVTRRRNPKGKEDKPKKIPSYFVSVLPFILAVQDFKKHSPEALINRIGNATKKELRSNTKLRKELNKYLLKYGYETLAGD